MSTPLLRTLTPLAVVLSLAVALTLTPGCGDSGGSVDGGGDGSGDNTGGDGGSGSGSGAGSGSGSDSGGDTTEPLTGYGSLTFVGDLAEAMCSWAVGCCTLPELEDVMASFGSSWEYSEVQSELAEAIWQDPSLCGPSVRSLLIDRYRLLETSIVSGRAQLDPAGVPACVAYYGGSTCPERASASASGNHPCSTASLAMGLVPDGTLCVGSYECAAGSYCDSVGSVSVCRPYISQDQACPNDAACAVGHCAGSEPVCVTQDLDIAPWCSDDAHCPAGQMCAHSIDRCIDTLELDAVCIEDRQCATGYCALDTTQRCIEKLSPGAPCTADIACDAGYCDESVADIHRCVPITLLSLDQPCDDGAGLCDGHLVCHDGTCVSRSDMGGPCDHDGYCPSTGYCDAGTCVPRVAVGGGCTADGQCVAIGWCDEGICVARIALGLPCELGDACVAGGYCDVQFGVVGTCAALPDAGSDCPAGACAEGLSCVTFEGSCAATVPLDEPCDRSEMCGPNGQCVSPATSTYICQPPQVVGEGEHCASEDKTCDIGLVCDGTCKVPGLIGAVCTWDEDCIDGSSCIKGSCSPLSGAYGYCDSAPDCSLSLYCDLGVNQCTPMKTVDQSCLSDAECLDSLYCDPSSGTCSWEKALNEACSPGAPCKEGLFCANNGLCTSQVLQGFPCEVGVYGMCVDGLSCIDGLCTGPPSAGLPCHPDLGCADTAYCDDATNHCVARIAQGGVCDKWESECVEGAACQELGSSCKPRTPEGGSCWQDSECQSGAACEYRGTCRPPVPAGAFCDSSAPCESGSTCQEGICIPEITGLEIGDLCGASSECASGRCWSGVCVGFCQGN